MQSAQASLDSFEKAGAPAALVGSAATVLATNPSFDGLIGQVIARSRGGVPLADARANSLFHSALAQLELDTLGDRRSIALPSLDDSPAFIRHITPIRRQARDVFSRAEAILVVTTSDRSLRTETSILCEPYDLTRAEAAIANGLLDGLSADEIAAVRGVGRETIRTQIKRVLGKTGRAHRLTSSGGWRPCRCRLACDRRHCAHIDRGISTRCGAIVPIVTGISVRAEFLCRT